MILFQVKEVNPNNTCGLYNSYEFCKLSEQSRSNFPSHIREGRIEVDFAFDVTGKREDFDVYDFEVNKIGEF